MGDNKKNHIDNIRRHMEHITMLEHRENRLESLVNLSNRLRDKERRLPIPFNDFLKLTTRIPELAFRDIFQLFYDMIHHYVPPGLDEYEDHSHSIGFMHYDCYDLFKKNCDNPYFADRIFANRFMHMIDGFKSGTLNNHIFLFEGPPGSGKSTFLNNLLQKLEEYIRTPEGVVFKTYWRLDIEKLGGFQHIEPRLEHIAEHLANEEDPSKKATAFKRGMRYPKKYLEFSCPKHDHPILQIPKSYRAAFLDELLPDGDFKRKLFNRKEYEWVLKDIPCSICKALFETLLDILGDPLEVFNMIYARKAHYNRQFGEGITIFNPGDSVFRKPIYNQTLQSLINDLLKNDGVDFVYSVLAKTNNGVYALMDIKENNIERLKNLHGIISDGVHKVELVEEHVKALFVGLVNPEDKKHYENVKSFQDRIITVNIPYVMDYNTEVAIYKNKFGNEISEHFLPGVLQNVAKIIIATRLENESLAMKEWIKDTSKYNKYLDKNALLLKMELYTGEIPAWLNEEDIKKFDKTIRKKLLAESELEGNKGFSGRQSLKIFNSLFAKFIKSGNFITMDKVTKYFSNPDEVLFKMIPEGFLKSLQDMYDYNVLQDIKEAIYYYNRKQISTDIQNYLYAINYEIGETAKSDYTGDTIDVTEDYFKNFEVIILGPNVTDQFRKTFRKDTHNEYITRTLSQEIRVEGLSLDQTTLFKTLFEKYTKNLKENALTPYIQNDNFRRAINDFNSPQFKSYDKRLKRDVTYLLENLQNKFNYTLEGARQISKYVIDKKIFEKFKI